jgi:hypothetical protein
MDIDFSKQIKSEAKVIREKLKGSYLFNVPFEKLDKDGLLVIAYSMGADDALDREIEHMRDTFELFGLERE